MHRQMKRVMAGVRQMLVGALVLVALVMPLGASAAAPLPPAQAPSIGPVRVQTTGQIEKYCEVRDRIRRGEHDGNQPVLSV